MFGDIMGMMGKLKETQQKVEETKKRLDFVLIDSYLLFYRSNLCNFNASF